MVLSHRWGLQLIRSLLGMRLVVGAFFYRASAQEGLMMNGESSPACFFTRLANFFSFGVRMARFFASLLDRWDLDIVFTPVSVDGTRPRTEEG